MKRGVACVVEGHGDVLAFPVLLRRLAESLGEFGLGIHPHRVPRSKMLDASGQPGAELNRALVLQGERVGDDGLIVVLLDSDDDDPEPLAEVIEGVPCRARVIAVVAVREYEAWFLAAIDSLRRHPAVLDDAVFEGDPEARRDAKGHLSAQMNVPYQVTLHQPAFTAAMDLTEAARAMRLAGFVDVFTRWITGGQAGEPSSR